MSRARGFWLAAVLAGGGAMALAGGGYIHGKAWLAQELLENAWHRTLAGDERAVPWPWADTWPVARLRLPRLAQSLLVLEGASGASLAFGPGHLTGSAEPGEPGNSIVAGHRDTHFAFLRHVLVGDVLTLETPAGARVSYVVREVAVVHERSVAVLAPTASPTLTLVTCWPFDALLPGGPERFVVQAERI